MTRDQWQRAKPLLLEAISLEPSDQQRLVQQRYPGDAALQQELLELIRCHTLATVRLPTLSTLGASPRPESVGDQTWPDDFARPPVTGGPSLPLLESGDMCGRHRVVRNLGTGAMGQVYLAEDTELRTPVALKILSDAWLEAEARTQLRREARRAAELRGHPHIATLHDVIEVEVKGRRVPVMVMEYVEGAVASGILAESGPIRAPRAMRWACEIAGAIEYAHDRGVLHCDLKPSNVQITRDDHAKVLDFGVARRIYERPAGRNAIAGTPPYMAPEQLVDGQFTEAGDIYSLGVTLFEFVTGRRPFEAPTLGELLIDIIGAAPPKASTLVPNLPPGLDEILERALAKAPRQRYQSAGEFRRELTAVLQPMKAPGIVSTPVKRFAVAVGFIAIVTILGFVTSLALEQGLGLTTELGPTAIVSWLFWGLRSLIAPTVFGIILTIGFLLSASVVRFLSTIPGVRAVIERLSARARALPVGLASLPTSSLSQLLLVVHVVVLAALALAFSPLITGFMTFMTASRGSIDSLRPSNLPMHELYGYFLTSELLIFCVAWYRVLRRHVHRRERDKLVYIVAGAAAILLSLLLFTVRFRILSHSERERVGYGTETCYLVQDRGATALLFCPRTYPRNVVADLNRVKRTGEIESVFSVLDAAH